MATKYECDRCGNQTTDQNEIFNFKVPRLDYRSHPDKDDMMNEELCTNCTLKLIDFFKVLPKEDKK